MAGGLADRMNSMNTSTKRVLLAITLIVLVLIIVIVTVVATSNGEKTFYNRAEWENGRLNATVSPIQYDITLTVDVDGKVFSGYEEIQLEFGGYADGTVAQIVMHAAEGLKVTNPKFWKTNANGDEEEHDIQKMITWSHNSYVIFQFKDYLYLEEDAKYTLSLEWTAALEETFSGLYLSKYTEGGKTKYLASSQFQADSCRKAIPSFDEPGFKAKFNVKIIAAKKYPFVASNTESTDTNGECPDYEEKDGWKICSFKTTPKMSAYLLGFVIADYTCTSRDDSNTIKHRVCGTPTDIQNGNGEFALNQSIQFLEYYTTFYSQPYPLTKVDHIAVPAFQAGAMENWGIIIYRTTALMFDKETEATSNKFYINLVVGHELAHQWFGNLVTMNWWNDVWLNEGFATFAQGEGSADTNLLSNPIKTDEKSPNYENYLFKEDQMKAFGRDSYISSRAASVIVTDMSSFHYLFDEIAYQKGASLLQQLKLIMDPDLGDNKKVGSLQKGVSKYLADKKYGNAEQSELWAILDSFYSTDTPGVTIENVMNTWTLQMNFPVVMVSKVSDTELLLVQKRFVYMNGDGQDSPDSPYQYQWYVPIKGRTCTLDGANEEVQVCKEAGVTEYSGTSLQWIRPFHTLTMGIESADSVFINYNAQGYYFTMYSKDLWDSLITNFPKMALNSREQQLLLFETAQLIKAGYYEETRFGEILDAVVKMNTDDYRLMTTVLNHIKAIHSADREIKASYTDYVESFILNKLSAEIDFEENTYSEIESNLVAMDICLTIAPNANAVDGQEANGTKCSVVIKGLDIEEFPDFTTPYYMAHLYNETMHTNVSEWNKVWNMYIDQATSDSNKATLGSILAHTKEDDLVDKFISATRNSAEIKKSNGPLVLSRTIAPVRKEHLEKVVDDMLENWDEIYEYFGEQLLSLSSYIQGVVGMVTDQKTLDRIVAEFGDCSKWPALQTSYQSGLQKALTTISYE